MGFVGTNRQGQRIYHRRGAAPTLTCWTPIRVYEDQDRVRITRPREMARLQGVPEWLPVPKSEQAANSLMGNAVAAHVVAHVAQRLALVVVDRVARSHRNERLPVSNLHRALPASAVGLVARECQCELKHVLFRMSIHRHLHPSRRVRTPP